MAKTQTKKEELSLAVLDTLTTLDEYQVILDSGAIPGNLDTPQKLMTVVQTGKELGMLPMTAINNIHVIKGRTVISSAMLSAMLKNRVNRKGEVSPVEYVYTKDFVYETDAEGDESCITEIEFEFISEVTGKPKTAKFRVTWAEMERAGYTTKDNWQKYPKNMMRARCMAYAVRALFPEILLGVYSADEIVDAMDTGHQTSVNEEGDVVIEEAVAEDVTENQQ